MKPRHAAALALVGWYLLAPPLDTTDHLGLGAPLREWTQIGSFDTATECEDSLVELVKRMDEKHKEAVVKTRARSSVCIATDDPRLKGN